jgi:hypothetical protein
MMSDPIRQAIGNFANLFVNEPKPSTKQDPIAEEPKRTLEADSLKLGGIPPAVQRKLKDFAAFAAAESEGKRQDGYSYKHVMDFIDKQGFGNVSGNIPADYSQYARQFAEYADQNLAKLGLRKLPATSPHDAPPGALVVLKPGAPGTAHPVAGDISVRTETGFANGGEVQYGRPGDFKPGDVLGVYIPAR